MGTRERLHRTQVHGVSVRPNLHLQRVHTFVEFGEVASSPTYHTLDGTYYLTPNTIYTIGDALRGAIKSESGQTWWNGLFPSRKSHTGIWNDFDFDFVIDHSTSVASQRDIPIGQHLENVEVVLGAVSQSRAAQLNSKTLSLLSSNVKDVIWQIVERESAFVGNRWKENDWDATIKKISGHVEAEQ